MAHLNMEEAEKIIYTSSETTANNTESSTSYHYVENFEGNTANWQFTQGENENKWSIGGAAFSGEESLKGMYISNDGGLSNLYTFDSSSQVYVHAYTTLPVLPEGATEYHIAFDWKCNGENKINPFDFFNVWIVPVTYEVNYGINVSSSVGKMIASNLRNNPEWKRENVVVNLSEFAGQEMKIVFEWVNDTSGGNQSPAAVDNIEIKEYTCEQPTGLVLNELAQNQAQIAIGNAESQSVYQYIIGSSTGYPSANAAPTGSVEGNSAISLTNLTPQTTYTVWVRKKCSDSDGTSFWVPISFTTLCLTFSNFPFYEGFNSNSETKNCWRVINGNQDDVTWDLNYAANAFEGDQVATITTDFNSGNNDDWLVSPEINLSVTPGAKRLKFHYRVQSIFEHETFRVMLSTSGAVPADFTHTLLPEQNYTNQEYVEAILPLEDASGQPFTGNVTIAFHVPQTNNDGYRLYIDNVIVEDLSECEDVTNIKTCAGATDASAFWDTNENAIGWEYTLSPGNSGMPTSNGTFVNEAEVLLHNLTLNQTYDLWVRAVCVEGVLYSGWKKVEFRTSTSNLKDINPFCAGAEGLVFPNVHQGMGVPDLTTNDFHCLSSTPNPVWYYLKIQNSGNLEFDIIQNTVFDANGNPVGDELDVDFAIFGPFDSVDNFCTEMTIANGSPAGNPLIDCSYSTAAVESFTLTNAQEGQIYVLLITNYEDAPGFIKLVQTNLDSDAAGSTDCSFLCTVDLGEDIIACQGTEVELEAKTQSAGGGNDLETIVWLKNGQPMDPLVYNTTTISVTESGVYQVKIAKENCTEEFIFDEVNVTIVPKSNAVVPSEIVLCDDLNDGKETFELKEFINQLSLAPDFQASFYETLSLAEEGKAENALADTLRASEQNVFLRIQSKAFDSCFEIFPVKLQLTPVIYPQVAFSYETPVCFDLQAEIYPKLGVNFTKGGVFSSSSELIIDSETGVVDVNRSKPGVYEVVYRYVVPEGFCGDNAEFTTHITITEPIQIGFHSYCDKNELFIEAYSLNPKLKNLTFEWLGVNNSKGAIAHVLYEGTYQVRVFDQNGCSVVFDYQVKNVSCLIPKGISPNGDGLNDNFDLTNYHPENVRIFNRHGKEVYSYGKGYTNQWNGQDKSGKLLPNGTYYYSIQTQNEELSGYVQLIREL